MRQAWRDIRFSSNAIYVHSMKSWRAAMRTWTSLHQQHDVVEFAEHIINHAKFPCAMGGWAAHMLVENTVRVWDSGATSKGICLRLPEVTDYKPRHVLSENHRYPVTTAYSASWTSSLGCAKCHPRREIPYPWIQWKGRASL